MRGKGILKRKEERGVEEKENKEQLRGRKRGKEREIRITGENKFPFMRI